MLNLKIKSTVNQAPPNNGPARQNLKIVIDNNNNNKSVANDAYEDIDSNDSSEQNMLELAEEQLNGDEFESVKRIDDNISNVSEDQESLDKDEDEIEFHVNLDKVPPSLQNTILVFFLCFI